MEVTKDLIAQKLVAYLEGAIQRSDLVDWAEDAIREGSFVNDAGHKYRDIVARIGLADAKAFGLEWRDHETMLKELGYKARVIVQPQP